MKDYIYYIETADRDITFTARNDKVACVCLYFILLDLNNKYNTHPDISLFGYIQEDNVVSLINNVRDEPIKELKEFIGIFTIKLKTVNHFILI